MQANEVKKERKPMTPEQLEALKARLMKAREAKIERDKKRYEFNKDEVKKEAVKKRALTKVKKLVDAGTLKEEELQKVLPVKQEVKNEMPIPVEIPFEEPLPSKPVNIPKPKKAPDVMTEIFAQSVSRFFTVGVKKCNPVNSINSSKKLSPTCTHSCPNWPSILEANIKSTSGLMTRDRAKITHIATTTTINHSRSLRTSRNVLER